MDDVYDHLIELDPTRMRETGIELDDVVDAKDIQTACTSFHANVSLPPAILVSYKGRRVQGHHPIHEHTGTGRR